MFYARKHSLHVLMLHPKFRAMIPKSLAAGRLFAGIEIDCNPSFTQSVDESRRPEVG